MPVLCDLVPADLDCHAAITNKSCPAFKKNKATCLGAKTPDADVNVAEVHLRLAINGEMKEDTGHLCDSRRLFA